MENFVFPAYFFNTFLLTNIKIKDKINQELIAVLGLFC